MNTHFHLLVSMSSVERFSKAMKELKRLYANWAHVEQKRYGPIWWGRFGSQLVEDEKYLLACGLYIEMNPVKGDRCQGDRCQAPPEGTGKPVTEEHS